MLPCLRSSATRRYRVEVSGWDRAQNFFVEHCDLLWSEEAGKRVTLQQKLRNASILFVRLLAPEQSEAAHPVVYEAEWVGPAPAGGYEFRLRAMAPRLREQVTSMV